MAPSSMSMFDKALNQGFTDVCNSREHARVSGVSTDFERGSFLSQSSEDSYRNVLGDVLSDASAGSPRLTSGADGEASKVPMKVPFDELDDGHLHTAYNITANLWPGFQAADNFWSLPIDVARSAAALPPYLEAKEDLRRGSSAPGGYASQRDAVAAPPADHVPLPSFALPLPSFAQRQWRGQALGAAAGKAGRRSAAGGCTTVMLRNIPCRYKHEDVLQHLDASGLAGLYDMVHVPLNASRRANLGYIFINFLSFEAVEQCQRAFTGKAFGTSGSKKSCEVSLAHCQGSATPKETKALRKKSWFSL